MMPDHVYMLLSVPPKYSVSNVVGFIKGKSAIHIARTYQELRRNYAGYNFWARGYYVTTVSRDEAVVRNYIRQQEYNDIRNDELRLFGKRGFAPLKSPL